MFDDRRRLCTSSPPRIERIHATASSRALGFPQDLQTSPHFTDIGHTSVAGRFIPCIYIYIHTYIHTHLYLYHCKHRFVNDRFCTLPVQDVTIHYSLSSNSLCRWTHQANMILLIQTICGADPHHPWHLSAFFLAWKPTTLCPIPWYKPFDAHRSLSRSSSTSMLESPSSHIIFIILKYHCGVTNHIPTTITTNHCIGQSIN